MNNDNVNQSSSNNTTISVCFSILIISIIILIFCDKDVLCNLLAPIYTVILVSISYLFLETNKCKTIDKLGGFVETTPLFKYTRNDIEDEKSKLKLQNEDISNILNKFDGFERYNNIQTNIISKGLNELNDKELEEEAADLLRVTRTDFIPAGMKKILLTKINDKISFSDGVINKIIGKNEWVPDQRVFNRSFIQIVKKTFSDTKKGRQYINGDHIKVERLLNIDYLLKPDFNGEIKQQINMLEKEKILNNNILSQCGKLLYSILPHHQDTSNTLKCTDYYFTGKLMSESDDESLENNKRIHSSLISYFENITSKNIDDVEMPSGVKKIECNVEKVGSAELTQAELRKLKLLEEMKPLGLDNAQQNEMNILLKKQGVNKNSKLTVKEDQELAKLSGKVSFGLNSAEKKRIDELLIKQGSKPLYSKVREPIKSTPQVLSSAESANKTQNIISNDVFRDGVVSNDRQVSEDNIKNKNPLVNFTQSILDTENDTNVFSRNLILRRPAITLLNRTYLGDTTHPFDGELQSKNYNEFRDKIYKLYMYNINDLHLRFMAHFMSNKKRLAELSSINDKCLERIQKIGDHVKTLEEEIITAKGMKERLELLEIIEKETNKLRGEKIELEIQLEDALNNKGSWKTTKDLEAKIDELEKTLDEKQKLEKEVKEVNQKNSDLLVSSAQSRMEISNLDNKLKSTREDRDLLIKENKDKEMEITKMKNNLIDLKEQLDYLQSKENRIIAETKFSEKIRYNINDSKINIRKITGIVSKLKDMVTDKFDNNKKKLNDINKKVSSTVNKLEQKIVDINALIIKTNTINSNYNKNTIKWDEETLKYKNDINKLNIQMNEIKRLLKPFFVSNGTGFEYLKQHLENLNNEKRLIKEELSKTNFSILSKNVKNNISENEPEFVGNKGRFVVNEDKKEDVENTNFAEFVGKYNNELNISKRIKLFKRLQEIDLELHKQYNLIERYNQFVDKIFNEFKKVEKSEGDNFILLNDSFLKEYEFLALNYRNYVLDYKKVSDMNNTLVSKNNILSKRINELSLENKLLSNTISSKEPDKLIVNMKDEIVRLNNDIDNYYKNNSGLIQDIEELKNSIQKSMEENSQLRDIILELEKNMDLMKKEYKKNLENAVDNYAVELNNDLDTMVILLNGSNNVEWDTNNAEISNTKKKQLFIISRIKELLLSNDNSKKKEIELEDVKKKLKDLTEESRKQNIVREEMRETIKSFQSFVDYANNISTTNNSELTEMEKTEIEKNELEKMEKIISTLKEESKKNTTVIKDKDLIIKDLETDIAYIKKIMNKHLNQTLPSQLEQDVYNIENANTAKIRLLRNMKEKLNSLNEEAKRKNNIIAELKQSIKTGIMPPLYIFNAESKAYTKQNIKFIETMKDELNSLNEKAKIKNNTISELKQSILLLKEFINSSGVMSSSNMFKTNTERYEEERIKMQENIKLLENDKNRLLEDMNNLQTIIEQSNKESKEVNNNMKTISDHISKASDYMATPLGFHTKNALVELFKCISSNSIKRIMFHKLFKRFFTRDFSKKFSIQENLSLNISNLGDVNIFTEDALNEIYKYTTDSEGEKTNLYTDIFSKYLKEIKPDMFGEIVGNAENEEDEWANSDHEDDDGDIDDIEDTVEYVDYKDVPNRWNYNSVKEYQEAVELSNKKNVKVNKDVVISKEDIMDGGLIIILILEKFNVINKESKYYTNIILPLFEKYRIRENSFNEDKFVRKCFDDLGKDTNNYINKIRNLDLSLGKLTMSIIKNSDRVDEKTKSLLSLEKYTDEIMKEEEMIYALYSLDKYENIEIDYLVSIIILDIKNYESLSSEVKLIQSKLDNVKKNLSNIEFDLIKIITPQVNNLNTNYFSMINTLKGLLFTNKNEADSFINNKLKQFSNNDSYNKFNEIQSIIITKLIERFDYLTNKVKKYEDSLNVDQKLDSDLYNIKGLLQVYKDRVLEISKRFGLYSIEVKKIATDISNSINKVKSDKEKLNKVNGELIKLQKVNKELSKKMDNMVNNEKNNLAEINSLNESLEKINSDIVGNLKKKESTSSAISSLDESIKNTSTRILEYDTIIKQLNTKVNELSAIEIGRNRINSEIKSFIIEISTGMTINDESVISRLKSIKQKLDDNLNEIREKEDEKKVLTEFNNELTADRDRIILNINELLKESIISDDKQWMSDMENVGIKLDLINKFIEKWENNGNDKISKITEILKQNNQISAEIISKLNVSMNDISTIDSIINKIQPYIKKPEELVVKYDSELIKYREELEKAQNQKNLLEKRINEYVLDKRNKIIFINELDTRLRNYINENSSLKMDMDMILSKYNETIKEKEELNMNLKKIEDGIDLNNLEMVRLNEEIQTHKNTIIDMSKTIEDMQSKSKSMIDKKQCSDYIKGIIDPVITTLSNNISSINEISKIADIISNTWSKGNLDISNYIQKNKILEEEIKKLSSANIEYEKQLTDFKKSEKSLKNLSMVLELFTNKSDKTILEKLKLIDLNTFNNSQELEKYLNAKIDLSIEIVEGFKSVVNNYESIRNIIKDNKLAGNIENIISKCIEYKKMLSNKNITKVENMESVNEILLSKEELQVKIKELENKINLLSSENIKQLKELKDQFKGDEYINNELSKFEVENQKTDDYSEDIEYVQKLLDDLESIVKEENINVNIDELKYNLNKMLNLSDIYLNKEDTNKFTNLYNNLTKGNVVELNPLVKNILRNLIKKKSDYQIELKRKELVENANKFNQDLNDRIMVLDLTFKSNISMLSDKLDRYKLLFLKTSGEIINYINIVNVVKNKIIGINLELNNNRKKMYEILDEKQKAINLNKELKKVETITIDTSKVLQQKINIHNKDIVKIQIYLEEILEKTKNLKLKHSAIVDELLLSKYKPDKEKEEVIAKYNESLEIIETTNKALKECNDLDKKYDGERILAINQLNINLIEAQKLLNASLINIDQFSNVVKKSIDNIYDSIQEINLISAITGKLKENINRNLALKEDINIMNEAIKNEELYNRIVKEFKTPIEKQIQKNKLLIIELNATKNSVDFISKKYKDSIINKNNTNICNTHTEPEIRVVDEIIYVDRNNNIIMPNNIIVKPIDKSKNAKKVNEPITEFDKYRKQLVKQ